MWRPRVLIMTRLFPNAVCPYAALFNRQQFTALARFCDVHTLAVIPWFPGANLFARWSEAGRLGDVPARERIGSLMVAHPRAVYVPRLFAKAPALYAAS